MTAHSSRSHVSRPLAGHPVGLAVAAAAIALAAVAFSADAGIRVCTDPDVPLPPSVEAARQRPDPPGATPYGWSSTVETLRRNRKDVEQGRLTPADAAARGGTVFGGTRKVPVFLVKFANTQDSETYDRAQLQQELFGSWPTGTVRDYYEEVSYGWLDVQGTVYDWTQLAHDDTYYEGGTYFGEECHGTCNVARIDELIEETIGLNDAAIDFGQYDNDGPDGIPNSGDDDGKVDFIAFVHSEQGAECETPSTANNIWSHKWDYSGWTGHSYTTNDPRTGGGHIRIDDYTIQPGWSCDTGEMIEIGVFCHEIGHAFGLPDFYDTNKDNGESEGIGEWGIMGGGSWNSPERPAHMMAFCRERLGWLSYFNVTVDTWLTLPPLETTPFAVRMWKQGAPDSPEYFVVENRQRIGFDENLNGRGFVIYHVDEDVYDFNIVPNTVNADEAHKAVDVECADALTADHVANADDLDTTANRGDPGDVWCPSTQVDFDQFSVPDSRSYSGVQTGVGVRSIQQCTGDIRASFIVGVPQVGNLCMQDCEFDNQCQELTYGTCDWWWTSPDIWIDNNDDGVQDMPAWNLDNHLWFRVHNASADELADVKVDLYYGDPQMGMLWPSTGTHIGTVDVPILGAWEPYEDYVAWQYPLPPSGVDHYCVGAVVHSPQDPQNSEFAPNDNNVAQVNHQILVMRAGQDARNASPDVAVASGAIVASECGGHFEKKSRILLGDGFNPTGGLRMGEVRVGMPPNFDDAEIPANWTFGIEPGTGPFPLTPGEPDSVFAIMKSNNAAHGETARVPLTLWDVNTQQPIGGVLLEYVIDCIEPAAPAGLQVTCLSPTIDDLDGPNVRLDWGAVVQDAIGGAETVLYYEITRTDGNGVQETFTTAVDESPDDAGVQWYDTIPRTIDETYTYRVRAIDWAKAPGPWSNDAVAGCSVVVGVGEPGIVAGPRLGAARPNPFTASTTIVFEVPVSDDVTVQVFNAQGERVRTLAMGRHAAGTHRVTWDGRSDAGVRVPSGVYFYQLAGSDVRLARKLVMAR